MIVDPIDLVVYLGLTGPVILLSVWTMVATNGRHLWLGLYWAAFELFPSPGTAAGLVTAVVFCTVMNLFDLYDLARWATTRMRPAQ